MSQHWAISFDLTFKPETPSGLLAYFGYKIVDDKGHVTVQSPWGMPGHLANHLKCCISNTSINHGSWRIKRLTELPEDRFHFASLASCSGVSDRLVIGILEHLRPHLEIPDYRVLVRKLWDDTPQEQVCWFDPIYQKFVWENGWTYKTSADGVMRDPNHPVNHGKVEWEEDCALIKKREGPLLFFQPPMDIRELRRIHGKAPPSETAEVVEPVITPLPSPTTRGLR